MVEPHDLYIDQLEELTELADDDWILGWDKSELTNDAATKKIKASTIFNSVGGKMPVTPISSKYFVRVPAPSDQNTPVGEIVALFTRDAFINNGINFTGLSWTVPPFDEESIFGFALPVDVAFSRVILETIPPQDVTSFYIQVANIDIDGEDHNRYIAIDSLDWVFPSTQPRTYRLEV